MCTNLKKNTAHCYKKNTSKNHWLFSLKMKLKYIFTLKVRFIHSGWDTSICEWEINQFKIRKCHIKFHKKMNCNSALYLFLRCLILYILHIHTYILVIQKFTKIQVHSLISKKGKGRYCIGFLVLFCLNTFIIQISRKQQIKSH